MSRLSLLGFDKEIREITKIIKKTQKLKRTKNDEYDEIFNRRLKTNKIALKMSFWENHFEWRAVLQYPEIIGKVLDFGCGSGHSDIMLARNGFCIHGIDLSDVGITIAKFLLSKEQEKIKSQLSFSVADITKDRPPNGLYDSVWSSHVFEHINDPKPILNGLRLWLKPNAPILISVPLGNAYDDPGHVNHFYNTEQLIEYLGKEVIIDKIQIDQNNLVIRALFHLSSY